MNIDEWNELYEKIIKISEDDFKLKYGSFGFHHLKKSEVIDIEFFEGNIYEISFGWNRRIVYERDFIPWKMKRKLNNHFYPILARKIKEYKKEKENIDKKKIFKLLGD